MPFRRSERPTARNCVSYSDMSRTHYSTSVFLGSTAFVFLNFGLPIRADDLGWNAMEIGGMYTVFMGTMLLVRPLVGVCLDRFGRRWFFIAAFVFYTLAMSLLSVSEDLQGFYLARCLQGIGASLMWVSVRTIIADTFARDELGVAMGRLTTTSVRGSMLGGFYGFTLLGFLPMSQAWAPAFAGYAVMAFLALVWSLLRVREPHRDFEVAPSPGESWFSLDLARIFFIVFISGFASALIEPIYLIYLKNKFDAGALLLAWVFLPAGVVFAILPRYAGAWSDRFGRGRVIALGVAFAGLVSLALPFWPHLLLVAVSYLLFSAGWAMASPAEDALVADLAPADSRGRVIGTKEAAAGVGAALGPLVGGALYDNVAAWSAFVLNGALLLTAAVLAVIWFDRVSGTGDKTGNS